MPIMQVVTTPSDTPRVSQGPTADKKDRGATMVEFAIVAVWLFALIFMVIEGAFAVRARNTMANAIDDAARRGAVAASAPNADYQILFQLFGRGASTVSDVEYVTIYRTESGSAEVPTGCKNGIQESGVCNVYYPASFLDPATQAFNANEASFDGVTLGSQWKPETRGTDPDTIEFIGVYVKAEYRSILQGVLTDNWSVTVSGSALQAIETTAERAQTP